MLYIIILLLIIIIAVIGVYFYKNKEIPQDLLIKGCYRKKLYLTKTEREFYKEMKASISNEYTIGFQTRIVDLFNMPKDLRKNDYSKYMKIFGTFSRKTVDFIILDKNFKILCAIELDDKSHNRAERKQRDYKVNQLFAYIKIPLVRYKVGNKYNFESLKTILNNLTNIEKNLSVNKIEKLK